MKHNLEIIIEDWLRTKEPRALDILRKAADAARSRTVGHGVHLRALIAIPGSACTPR